MDQQSASVGPSGPGRTSPTEIGPSAAWSGALRLDPTGDDGSRGPVFVPVTSEAALADLEHRIDRDAEQLGRPVQRQTDWPHDRERGTLLGALLPWDRTGIVVIELPWWDHEQRIRILELLDGLRERVLAPECGLVVVTGPTTLPGEAAQHAGQLWACRANLPMTAGAPDPVSDVPTARRPPTETHPPTVPLQRHVMADAVAIAVEQKDPPATDGPNGEDLLKMWLGLREEADRAEAADDLWGALRLHNRCALLAYDSALRPDGDTAMYRATLWDLHRVGLRRGDLWSAHGAATALLTLDRPPGPAAVRDRPHLQEALLRLAATYRARGNRADAVLAYDQALELCHQAAQERATDAAQHDLCDVLDALGHLLEDGGDLGAAGDRFRQLLALRRGLAERHDCEAGRRHLAHAFDDVGRVAEAAGWVDDAATAYANAASLRRG